MIQHFLLTLVAAVPPTAADGAVKDMSEMSLFDYIRDGGLISYVLIALSIGGLALIVRNLVYLRKDVLAPRQVVEPLERLLAGGALEEARALCRTAPRGTFIANVMGEALERCESSTFGTLELRAAVQEAAQSEGDRVHRMNDGLAIIAAIGPMLGLLGTVIGMIGAFRAIGGLQGAARSNELATFMSMALVNTAEGLIVAIPCTIAYALFRRRIDQLLQELGRDLDRLIALAGGLGPRTAAGRGAESAPAAAAAARGVR